MAFATTTIAVSQLAAGIDKSPLYDALASALATQTSSLTSLGGPQVLARVTAHLACLYKDSNKLSAAALLSVAASSTSSLLTLQLQIIPAV